MTTENLNLEGFVKKVALGPVAESADALDLKSSFYGSVGSSPTGATNLRTPNEDGERKRSPSPDSIVV